MPSESHSSLLIPAQDCEHEEISFCTRNSLDNNMALKFIALAAACLYFSCSGVLATDTHHCFETGGTRNFVELGCGEAHFVKEITSARWGVFGATCSDRNNDASVCEAKTSPKSLIANACIGEVACQIEPWTSWFGRPCARVQTSEMSLFVEYVCTNNFGSISFDRDAGAPDAKTSAAAGTAVSALPILLAVAVALLRL